MIVHQSVYLPDGETHLVDWMNRAGEMVDGKGTYQIKKLRAALSYCGQKRMAVDIGAHCGLWSMQLVKSFEHVYSFEPVAAHRDCYMLNLQGHENATLVGCALGEKQGFVEIVTEPTSSGDSRVSLTPTQQPLIPLKTLDSFELQDVDFIKIDTEGYELFAIRGAEETIKRCRPVMIVEQKGHGTKYFGFRREEGVELLQSWGMIAMQPPLSGDWIIGWPE